MSNAQDDRLIASECEGIRRAVQVAGHSEGPHDGRHPPHPHRDGEQNIGRIVLTSTQGAGDDWARLNPVFKALISVSNLKASYDHYCVDRVVRASDTDWTWLSVLSTSSRCEYWLGSRCSRAAGPG